MTSRRAGALAAIATIPRALGAERERVIFVGGTVTALDPLKGGSDVRPTKDVDCVIDVATTHEYYDFVGRLRELGFQPCADEDAPLCRLVCAGIRVDVSATVDTCIGPTNRWYRDAVAHAATYAVAADVEALAIRSALAGDRNPPRGGLLPGVSPLGPLLTLASLRVAVAHQRCAAANSINAHVATLPAGIGLLRSL